jgi:hypothetical protein
MLGKPNLWSSVFIGIALATTLTLTSPASCVKVKMDTADCKQRCSCYAPQQ